MIAAVIAALAKLLGHRTLPRYPRRTVYEPWETFQAGRAAEGCGDPQEAAKFFLEAAKGGLPVAEVFMWHSYRVGVGVVEDPVAATAWGLRATAHGWPRVLLTPEEHLAHREPEAEA